MTSFGVGLLSLYSSPYIRMRRPINEEQGEMDCLRLVVCAFAAVAFAAPSVAKQTRAPAAKKTAVKTEVVARGLVNPWALQFLPDGRYLVTEKAGHMRIVTKDGKISEPIAGVPEVFSENQGGLLDVVL